MLVNILIQNIEMANVLFLNVHRKCVTPSSNTLFPRISIIWKVILVG